MPKAKAPAACPLVWTDAERNILKHNTRLRQLFRGQHEMYFVLPNGEQRRYDYVTINWLGDSLSQTWKRMLFRRFPLLTGDGSEEQQAAWETLQHEMNLPAMCQPAALMVSWAGAADLKLYYSQAFQRVGLRLWGANNTEFARWEYFDSDAAMPKAVNCWYRMTIPGRAQKTDAYVCERHELMVDEDGAIAGVRVSNQAWKIEGTEPVRSPIAWEELYPDELTRPMETEDILGLMHLPVVRVENIDRDGDGQGDSDYTDSLICLNKNVNKLVGVRQLVIDLCEMPFLEVPPEMLDEAGNFDFNKAKIRIRYGGEPSQTISLVNWTGNLQNSAAQLEHYRQEYRTLTGIAPTLMGDAEAGSRSLSESGYSRRLSMVPTEVEVMNRRAPWERAFTELMQVGMWLHQQHASGPEPMQKLSAQWPAAIPEDAVTTTTTTVAEMGAGLRSLESAVALLNPDASPQWRQKEVDRILAERATAQAALGNPFAPGPQEDQKTEPPA